MSVVRRVRAAWQAHRRAAVIAVVVAVVVAATAGVGISWATAAAPSMTPDGPSARVERDGLVLTLRVGAGPYFLRELLPVSVSLTNVSNTPVYVSGSVDRSAGINSCGSMFGVDESGGHTPTYQAPNAGWMSCPGIGPLPAALAPGRTVSASDVLPITATGRVTFAAHAGIESVTTGPDGERYATGIDPFQGHEPSLQLTVSPTVPPQRMIRPVRYGTRVYVLAPLPAETHLRYIYTVSAGGCGTGSFGWEPITLPVIDDHPCAGQYGTWTYAVGAPGYAIAGETVSGISP